MSAPRFPRSAPASGASARRGGRRRGPGAAGGVAAAGRPVPVPIRMVSNTQLNEVQQGQAAQRGARPCAVRRPAGPRQDHACPDRRARARGQFPRHLGAGHRQGRRPRGAPDQSRGARRPLHRRDPPAQSGGRGDPLSGDGGLPARPHHRRGAGGALGARSTCRSSRWSAPPRAPGCSPTRCATASASRSGSTSTPRPSSRGSSTRGAARARRGDEPLTAPTRSRAARAARRASPGGCCAACATSRMVEQGRVGRPQGRRQGAAALLEVDARGPRRRWTGATSPPSREQLRRRAGRHRDASPPRSSSRATRSRRSSSPSCSSRASSSARRAGALLTAHAFKHLGPRRARRGPPRSQIGLFDAAVDDESDNSGETGGKACFCVVRRPPYGFSRRLLSAHRELKPVAYDHWSPAIGEDGVDVGLF